MKRPNVNWEQIEAERKVREPYFSWDFEVPEVVQEAIYHFGHQDEKLRDPEWIKYLMRCLSSRSWPNVTPEAWAVYSTDMQRILRKETRDGEPTPIIRYVL